MFQYCEENKKEENNGVKMKWQVNWLIDKMSEYSEWVIGLWGKWVIGLQME